MPTSTARIRARRLGRRLRGSVPRLARKVAALRVREWRYLLHAQFALLWAQTLVWRRPLGGLVDSAPSVAPSAGEAPGGAATNAESTDPTGRRPAAIAPDEMPRQLALAIRRAAAYGVFRPLCLVRSVALHRMLEFYGFPGGRIRVGVRWVGGKFAAHAWVEYEGQVLGDDVEHVNRFADLSEVRVLKWS